MIQIFSKLPARQINLNHKASCDGDYALIISRVSEICKKNLTQSARHCQPLSVLQYYSSSLKLMIVKAYECVPQRHDMPPADGPAAVVPDDDRRAISVHPQGLALVWALAEPFVVLIGEPCRKFRHASQLDEIVPFSAGGVLLHPAL